MSWGVSFMLFRMLAPLQMAAGRVASLWNRCRGTTNGHSADSYVHRYQYDVGFLQSDSSEEASNPGIARSRRRLRQLGIGAIASHPLRVTHFSFFERFVLATNPAHPWAEWLRGLPITSDEPATAAELDDLGKNKLPFMPPTSGLVEQYIDCLRWGDIDPNVNKDLPSPDESPKHRGGTIPCLCERNRLNMQRDGRSRSD